MIKRRYQVIVKQIWFHLKNSNFKLGETKETIVINPLIAIY